MQPKMRNLGKRLVGNMRNGYWNGIEDLPTAVFEDLCRVLFFGMYDSLHDRLKRTIGLNFTKHSQTGD